MNEPRKTTTEEYRKNWERVYEPSAMEKAKQRERQMVADAFNYLSEIMLKDDYPNGCSILEDK